MKIRFVKVNPVENMTIFVLDPIPKKSYEKVSKKLMEYSNLYAEQVGFITASSKDSEIVKLEMAGGEFCGNATRSLGALLVYNGHPSVKKNDNKYTIRVECSGAEGILECEVIKTESESIFYSKVTMPTPTKIHKITIKREEEYHLQAVHFHGILHFVVDSKKIKDKDDFFKIIKEEVELNYKEYDAFGIMFYNEEDNYLEPLVYVKNIDSLFWERSCGSGSCAVAAVLTDKEKKGIDIDLAQPGGNIHVSTEYANDVINNITINGKVEIVAEGIVNVNNLI